MKIDGTLTSLQEELIRLAIANNVLKFGQFNLKSGRTSPYFFNSGNLNDGQLLDLLGRCYTEVIIQTINQTGFLCEVLCGPVYKGIPLASAASMSLFNGCQKKLSYRI